MAYQPDGAGKAACLSAVAGPLSVYAIALVGDALESMPAPGGFRQFLYYQMANESGLNLGDELGYFFAISIVCLIGLVVFAFPLTKVMGDHLTHPAMAPVAVGLGAVCAWIPLAILVAISDPPALAQGDFRIPNYAALLLGAPTAFWWWFFYRRVLMRRDELAAED